MLEKLLDTWESERAKELIRRQLRDFVVEREGLIRRRRRERYLEDLKFGRRES